MLFPVAVLKLPVRWRWQVFPFAMLKLVLPLAFAFVPVAMLALAFDGAAAGVGWEPKRDVAPVGAAGV